MGTAATAQCQFGISVHFHRNSRVLHPKVDFSSSNFTHNGMFSSVNLYPNSPSSSTSKGCDGRISSLPDADYFFLDKVPTPILDMVENPIHLKNLSSKELRQLADDIRSELSFLMSKTQIPLEASLAVVELTIAIHHVFHAPVDNILWDVSEQVRPYVV
jgi:1-deoxy-D-xylulose-5-phosphate synthase